MKKAASLKVGDKVIYRCGYTVRESIKVDKPIDGKERPKFLIGRTDLADGGYILNGTTVYDSIEEAIADISVSVEERIKEVKHDIENAQIELNLLETIKKNGYKV